MYKDTFFDLLGLSGFQWIIAGILYALFDYIFNVIMCWVTGGLQNIHLSSAIQQKKISGTEKWKSVFRLGIQQFYAGGMLRFQEFSLDKLSWFWPITVLTIPTIVFGITHIVLDNTITDLVDINIYIENYRVFPFRWIEDRLQWFIWIVVLVISLSTLYRYRRRRSEPTWFSKSLVFHILRTLLFDFVLSYLVFSVILLWLDFSLALYNMLLDGTIVYPALHPDLMYGLRSVYEVVVGISIALLLLSVLPTLMLIRERKEAYSWMYYPLFIGGLITILVLGGVLIFQFDQRLESIQMNTLGVIYDQISVLPDDTMVASDDQFQMIATFQYFQMVSGLPNSFPVPAWLEYTFGARILLILYEVYVVITPVEESKIPKIIKRILQFIS